MKQHLLAGIFLLFPGTIKTCLSSHVGEIRTNFMETDYISKSALEIRDSVADFLDLKRKQDSHKHRSKSTPPQKTGCMGMIKNNHEIRKHRRNSTLEDNWHNMKDMKFQASAKNWFKLDESSPLLSQINHIYENQAENRVEAIRLSSTTAIEFLYFPVFLDGFPGKDEGTIYVRTQSISENGYMAVFLLVKDKDGQTPRFLRDDAQGKQYRILFKTYYLDKSDRKKLEDLKGDPSKKNLELSIFPEQTWTINDIKDPCNILGKDYLKTNQPMLSGINRDPENRKFSFFFTTQGPVSENLDIQMENPSRHTNPSIILTVTKKE